MTVPALVGLLRPSSENKSGDFVIMIHTHRFDPNDEQKKHNKREREGKGRGRERERR